MTTNTDAESDFFRTIIAQVSALTEPRVLDDGSSYIVHPEGTDVKVFTPVNRTLPNHIQSTVPFMDVASFSTYVNGYSTVGTKLFCNVQTGEARAIIDYHESGSPNYCSHQAFLRPQHSVQWKEWSSRNEKLLSQHDFAEFLEENAVDVISPDAALILEVVMGLQVKTEINVESALNLGNGSVQFRYSEEGTASVKGKGRDVVIPTKLTIRIPVFEGGSLIDIDVLFRYRTKDGLKFMVKIVRKDMVLLHAFQQAVREAAEATKLTPLFTTS